MRTRLFSHFQMLMSVPVTHVRTKVNVLMASASSLVNVLQNGQGLSVKIVKYGVILIIFFFNLLYIFFKNCKHTD